MKRKLTFLEKQVFPSDKLWIATYQEANYERYELRTNDESEPFFRILWKRRRNFGESMANFIYEDLDEIKKELPRLEEVIERINDLPYGDPVGKSDSDEDYYQTFLDLFEIAQRILMINPLFLPIGVEVFRLYIVHDQDKPVSSKAVLKAIRQTEKKQALYKKIFEDIFAEDPDTDRLSKYLNGTMHERKKYPAIRYGGITMEPAERTITGGVPNELKGRHHRFYNIGGEANKMFVAEVLNTESADELFSFWMSKYLKAQMKARPCKYCGRLFVPFLRQDSEYCDRLIEGSSKTCKELGAVKLYERRKVEEPAVKEYKRAYKTHFARIAYGRMTEEDFRAWSEKARQLRDECRDGRLSLVEFIAWLDSDKLR